jgi:hypothetical protein
MSCCICYGGGMHAYGDGSAGMETFFDVHARPVSSPRMSLYSLSLTRCIVGLLRFAGGHDCPRPVARGDALLLREVKRGIPKVRIRPVAKGAD